MRYLRSRLASPCPGVVLSVTVGHPQIQPCGRTTRPHTQAVRKQTLIAGAMSSCEQHHSLFTIASSSPPFLARPSLSPTHRQFLSPPLFVTAASRHRRFSSTLSGAAPSSPSRLLLRRAHSPASRATPTAQRRGEGSARQRCILGFRSATSLVWRRTTKSALLGWLSVSSRARIYLLERSF